MKAFVFRYNNEQKIAGRAHIKLKTVCSVGCGLLAWTMNVNWVKDATLFKFNIKQIELSVKKNSRSKANNYNSIPIKTSTILL